MSGWRQAGVLLLSGLVAGAVGYLTAPASAAPAPAPAPSVKASAPVAAAPVPQPASAPAVAPANHPDDAAALAECRARLKTCGALHRVAVVQDQGVAKPLSGAPDGFQPADVHAALKKVAQKCPDLRTNRVVTDCSEFPCLVWYPANLMKESPDKSLGDCSAWPFVGRGRGGMFMSAAKAPDGKLESYVVYVVDPHNPDETRLMWRVRHEAPKVAATWDRAGL